MQIMVKSAGNGNPRGACLVVGVYSKGKSGTAAARVDALSKGSIGKLLRRGDFQAAVGDTQLCYDLEGVHASRVLLLGLGEKNKLDRTQLAQAAHAAVQLLRQGNVGNFSLAVPRRFSDPASLYAAVRAIVVAVSAALYQPDQCKSERNDTGKPLKKMTLLIEHKKLLDSAVKAVRHGEAMASGIRLAKTLADLPGNICTPGYLADQARELGRKSGKLKVSVLSEKQMQRLGMGALLSVSRGSRQPAKLITLDYRGGEPGSRPIVLVGKGLTFDAGGISIKPSANMDEMKYDMCGGASVIGTLAACVELKLPINLVGLVPTSENLPDGAANKPGDIVTSMSGKTIEVLNTDAEGRLILCDALTYAGRYDPDIVIDIATLTGACVVALGKHASGLMGNDDPLCQEIIEAGEHSDDRTWRLPLWDDYQSQLDSNFADIANIGGRYGGAITAGCFLSRFTEDYRWAHLDIAGTAWRSGKDKGATGRPVGLLTQLLLARAGEIE